MPQSLSELKNVLRAGEGVSISANDYAAYDLMRLAGVAHEAKVKLTITDSSSLEKEKVEAIIGEGRNSVSLDRDVTPQETTMSEEDEEEEDFEDDDLDDDEEVE